MILRSARIPLTLTAWPLLPRLSDFNAEHGYPADPKPVALLVKDDDGVVIGGLWGRTVYGWLYVDYLIVPEQLRGRHLGSRLLLAAEDIARDLGCAGAWLTTFSFQAQEFHENLGYSVFGELEQSPRDNVRIFLMIERQMRPIGISRRNSLFAGSDGGAESWAILASLLQTAKLNGHDPYAWLNDVLTRTVSGEVKNNQLEQLLAWNWQPRQTPPALEIAA